MAIVNLPELPAWVTRENVSFAVLVLSILGFVGLMIFESLRNDRLRFTDVMTGDNGRYAGNKAFQTLTFLASLWVMLDIAIRGAMTETLLLGYCTVWGGLTAVNKAINNAANAKAQEMSAATGAPPPVPPATD